LNNKEISIVNSLTGELENKITEKNWLWKTNISTSGRYLFINYTVPPGIIYFKVYDLLNNNQVFDPKQKIDLNQSCKFSKDEKRILVTGPNGNSYYYEIGNSQPLRIIENLQNSNYGYLCLNDKFYIDCGLTNTLKLWNLETVTPETVLSLIDVNGIHKNLNDIYYHYGKKKYYTVGNEGTLTEHDIKDGKILKYFNITNSDLKILKSNLIDTLILSYSNKIQYFDLNQYKVVRVISMDFTNIIKISNDLKWIAGTALNQGTLLYNSELNKTIKLDSGRMCSYGVDFSSDSKYIAVGGTDHKLNVYDLSKVFTEATPLFSVQTQYKNPQDTTPFAGNGLYYIKFIRNDSMVVTSSDNFPNFKIWNAFTGDSIMQPFVKMNQGLFTRIIYLEYRKEFDDYISLDDWGVIIYWTKNFEYKNTFMKLIDPVNTQGYWAFEYLPNQNKLLAGGLQNWVSLLSLDGATDVENAGNISDGLLIYPNPARDYIEINLERCATLGKCGTSGQMQIFNTLGEIVLRVERSPSPVQKIDISKLSPGIYFIKIGNRVEKFVKM
jgi:WD40 repeat protein